MLALLLGSGPALAQDGGVVAEDGGPGYPPKMGMISGLYGTRPVAWETYDFSIGAFDASAWAMTRDGVIALSLMGYPPGEPDEMRQRILITAEVAEALQAGTVEGKVLVEIYKIDDRDGPRLTSEGQKTVMAIDKVVGAEGGGSGYGMIRGSLQTRLCPIDWPSQSCTDLSVSFESTLQYDGQVRVR